MPEFGPYEQPGWPTSLPYYKPGQTAMLATQLWANIGRGKAQLENQMMKMSLDAQNRDIANQIKIAQYEREMSQGNQRLAIAEQTVGLHNTLAALKEQQYVDGIKSIGDASTGLAGNPWPATDPRHQQWIYDILAKNAAAGRTSPWLFKNALASADHEVRAAQTKLGSDYMDFIRRFKGEIGRGVSEDLGLIRDPKRWHYYYRDEQGNLRDAPPPVDAQGHLPDYAKGWKEATDEDIYTYVPGAQGQPATQIHVQKNLRDQFTRELIGIEKKRADLEAARPRASDYYTPAPDTSSGQITIKDSNGQRWTIPSTGLDAAKKIDPNVVVIP